MFKPTALISLLLTLLLTACGGDSGSVVGGSNNSDGDTTTVGTGDNVTTGSDIDKPRLGTGSGSSFTIAALDIAVTTLSAGGTTNISANIVDIDNNNAKIASKQYGVEFTSDCADTGKAEFSKADDVTSNGSVSVTYKAKGCAGADLVSFKLYAAEDGSIDKGSVLHAASGSLTVIPPEVGAITFVGLSNTAISISTIANAVLPKFAEVTFKVLDQTNNPIEGRTVEFALTNEVGGLSLNLANGITNENGEVVAIVQSGSTHAVTSLVATTLANDGVTKISTSSLPISITSGIADQNSFNVVAQVLNPLAFDVTGSTVQITAYAGDAYGNPVADGTVVNFISESGMVVPSQCPTSNGKCSVEWVSTSPVSGGTLSDGNYKTDRVGFPGYDASWTGGRAGVNTILAYTLGEAGFADNNGNGLLDAVGATDDESYLTLSEAFLDANENGGFDLSDADNPYEKLVEFNGNGSFDSAPSTYQGVMCTEATKAQGHCANLVHVRDSVTIVAAAGVNYVPVINLTAITGSVTSDLSGNSCINVRNESPVSFSFNLTDVNGNVPPIDTGISFTADGFDVIEFAPTKVRNVFSTTGFPFTVIIGADDTFDSGIAKLVVKTTRDAQTSWSSVRLTDDPRITVTPDQYLLDVSGGNQTVTYTFKDACGNAPAANTVILFRLGNGQFAGGGTKLQISGADLTAGAYTVTYATDGTPSTGNVSITTIESNDGISNSVDYEIED